MEDASTISIFTVIGMVVVVGIYYWFVYRKQRQATLEEFKGGSNEEGSNNKNL